MSDMTDRTESQLARSWTNLLVMHGFGVWPVPVGRIPGRRNPGRGISDRIVMKNGITFFVEFKNREGRNKQEPSQKEFEGWVRRFGGRYFIVRSVEDVMEAIETMNAEVFRRRERG